MEKHVNLKSYDDVENLSNFSEASFEKYCDEKIDGCSGHLEFISKNCIFQNIEWEGKVCEVGSGNGKLLFRLEKENLISEGVGIEISPSRFRFAQKFKEYLRSTKIKNLNANVLEICPLKAFDLIIGIDVVLQLIAPVEDSAEAVFLDWVKKSLKPNGFLILELWDLMHIKKQLKFFRNNLKIWEEFQANDPWEFVLADINLDDNKDIVWKKTFLRRGANDRSVFINVLRPYSRSGIIKTLVKAGFNNIKIFDKWNDESMMQPGEYIVLAQLGLE